MAGRELRDEFDSGMLEVNEQMPGVALEWWLENERHIQFEELGS